MRGLRFEFQVSSLPGAQVLGPSTLGGCRKAPSLLIQCAGLRTKTPNPKPGTLNRGCWLQAEAAWASTLGFRAKRSELRVLRFKLKSNDNDYGLQGLGLKVYDAD